MTINLHPEPSRLSQAFADFVESRNWKSFAIVYELEEDLIKVKDLLKLPIPKIMIKQLPSSTNDYRKMFKDIKKSKEPNIVLSIGLDKVNETLVSARDIGLMTVYNSYLIASLDLKQLDLSEFARVNISGLSLHAQSVGKLLSVEEALLSDSVYLFAKAMDDLRETQSVTPPSLTCQSRTPWAYGSILMNIMRVVNIRALTGFLKFDSYGRRSDFDVDILELRKEAQSFRRVSLSLTPLPIKFCRSYSPLTNTSPAGISRNKRQSDC
jgi:ionotropic kainate glutamate receptor 2